jgi:uncharacterized protein (DUF58 family)
MNSAIVQLWQRWRSSQKQRIYIIPSRYGYAFAGLLILMLLGAINYNNSLGHLLSFLLASLGHVTMHHSHRNLRQITLNLTAMEPVFKGQPAHFKLTIHNEDSQSSYQLELAHKNNNAIPRWQFLKTYQSLSQAELIEANSNYNCTLTIPTHQRGWQQLEKIRIASLFPLGLFYAWSVYDQKAQVLVYPAPRGSLPLPSAPETGNQQHKHEQIGDDDFAGFRNYREGDPLHRVAWKASARDDVMRSKQFARPQGKQIMLRWQDLTVVDDIETRLSQLCNWILQAEAQGHQYGLELPDQVIRPAKGETHQHQCLKALALYHG